jgi:transposase-like protein
MFISSLKLLSLQARKRNLRLVLPLALITTILAITVIVFVFAYFSFRKKLRCPVCGSDAVEKIPKQWVTSPGDGFNESPITLTSHYRYKCRVCQNEWEDY